MRKINLVEEKRARNEEYAKRFKKDKKDVDKLGSRWLNWCRVKGHPSSCAVNSCEQR